MEKLTLRSKEVCEILGISPITFAKYIREGYINLKPINNNLEKNATWIFSKASVEALLKNDDEGN